MKKLLYILIFLVIGNTAWAQVTISSADEWNTFASNVNNGTTYSGQTVTLTADITITTSAGSSSTNSFKGTFEGGGHTLTLSLTHSSGGDAWIAPFRYINGATIKHLHTAGNISTNGKMAGGIVGDSWGWSTIQSCRSSVTISSSISGDGTHGGLVGRVNDGTLIINDCLFDGSITGSNTNSCGGFVGWKEASLVLNRCLQAGNLSGISSSGGATFVRFNNGSVDFTSCYYRTAYGTAQGTQTSATGSDLQTLLGSAWGVSGNDVLPIMDTRNLTSATISGVNAYYICTGNEIKPQPTVTTLDGTELTKDTHYSVTWSGDGTTEGDYTLTVTGLSPYYGTQEVAYTVVSANGNLGGYDFTVGVDADGSYYVVDGTAALNALAAYVNAGNNASGMRFKQTADIDMQGESYTPIGNDEDRPFKGTYDGDGYFVKNISHAISGNNEHSGFVGCLAGTVKNVNLKDCNFTAYRAGSIAGGLNEGSVIRNCNVLGGTITGTDNNPQDTHGSGIGGIVGYNFKQQAVDNCFVTAAFGGNAYDKGPVVGRTSGENSSITDCYYVNTPGGNTRGTQVTVYTITLGDGITMTGNFRTVGKTAENTYHFGKENDEVTLTATPVEGKTAIYSVNGSPIAGNTFTMPAEDVTVSVEYVMTWANVKAALQAGQSVTLANDVTRVNSECIEPSGTVTLDLNGYTIDGGTTQTNPLFRIGNGVSLTITDSQTGGNLCNAGRNATVSVNEGGSLTLAGGTINAQASGVSMWGGNFNMTGGTITGGSSNGVYLYGDNGSFTMTGGTIKGGSSGVYLNNDNATFIMSGGTITGNETGVEVYSAYAFIVSGNVNITGNTTKDVNLKYSGGNFNTIMIGGALNEAARIGINISDAAANAITGDVVKVITDGLKGKGTRSNFVLNGRDGHALVIPASSELGIAEAHTLTVPDDVTVSGMTTISANEYKVGYSDVVTLVASNGYEITAASYNDGSDHDIAPVQGVYSFAMPASDATVSVTMSAIRDLTLVQGAKDGVTAWWGTFYSGTENYTLSEGAAAYTMGTDYKLYRLGTDGRAIPAGTAVVIIATEATPVTPATDPATATVTLTPVGTASATDHATGGNQLHGSDSAVDTSGLSGTPHVLSISGGAIGFRPFTGASIPAGKAYYVVTP